MSKKDSFLTAKQIEILKLKKQGLSQTDIAKKMGTSRANISATAKTALTNIEKAKNTIKTLELMEAPIWMTFEADENLDDVVGKIYKKAGENDIWVTYDGPSLSNLIHKKAGSKIKGRRILSTLEIAVTEDGKIIVK